MLPGLLAALICAGTEPLPLPSSDGGAAAAQASKAPRKKPGKAALTGVLNVNRATEAELRLLPGIGKRRAELIVARRQKKPFATVDEGGRIKGVRAPVQRLRSRLTAQGGTALRAPRP